MTQDGLIGAHGDVVRLAGEKRRSGGRRFFFGIDRNVLIECRLDRRITREADLSRRSSSVGEFPNLARPRVRHFSADQSEPTTIASRRSESSVGDRHRHADLHHLQSIATGTTSISRNTFSFLLLFRSILTRKFNNIHNRFLRRRCLFVVVRRRGGGFVIRTKHQIHFDRLSIFFVLGVQFDSHVLSRSRSSSVGHDWHRLTTEGKLDNERVNHWWWKSSSSSSSSLVGCSLVHSRSQ